MRESIRDTNEYFKTRERKEKTNRNMTPLLESSHRRRYLNIGKSSYQGAGNVPVGIVVEGIVSKIRGGGIRRGIPRVIPFLCNCINMLLHGGIP